MYSKSTYRPRRTRIYGANYDIGESYYKGALDNLDSKSKTIRFADTNLGSADNSFLKREGRASSESSFPKSIASRNTIGDDEPIYFNAFDKAGSIEPKRLTSKFGAMQQELITSITNNDLLPSSKVGVFASNENARNSRISGNEDGKRSSSMLKKSFETDSFIKKSIIRTSKREQLEDNNVDTNAFLRAKATKTRLANLESEMMELSEKQNERERRNINLKKLLSDTDRSDSFN